MESTIYYILCGLLSIGVLGGIALMSKVKTAILGNMVSAVCMFIAVVITLFYYNVFKSGWQAPVILLVAMLLGMVAGLIWTKRVKMIQMPQVVALFNGFGGAASALVAIIALMGIQIPSTGGYFSNVNVYFSNTTAAIALAVGMITLIGSLIAAGKLHKILPQKPVVVKGHQAITTALLFLTLAVIIASAFITFKGVTSKPMMIAMIILGIAVSGSFAVFFAIRVGGADMPVVISLLNSLSGVAGSIAGMAIGDILLVAVGGIVGASGLLLTQIMCKAMNRKLSSILLGKTSAAPKAKSNVNKPAVAQKEPVSEEKKVDYITLAKQAKSVIIVPGYGMALAQAQHLVKQLGDKLVANGASLKYAIHPVAGRMPGHMNVLLAEADVPYDELYQMDDINDEFANTDLVIVIGANDVINPAANEAEGTPIYGMPILNVSNAKHILVFNYDTKPGYAGVDNPLYEDKDKTSLILGNAKDTLANFMQDLDKDEVATAEPSTEEVWQTKVASAKNVIIVPGYGMALAQAQHLVKQLGDRFVANEAVVKYAIHPVAGRMPGHMNVLLAEADVPYDELYQMDDINDEFKDADLVVVIGANDVINPAANEAEGTPIYGMPILNVSFAKYVLILNYDLKPGYAGVDNPLYKKEDSVKLLLGDASENLPKVIEAFNVKNASATEESKGENDLSKVFEDAKNVIIVPGYGMALAQAQHLVKQFADKLEARGSNVRFAIHPVAGRMPGHMNVLLAEADVPYDELYQMDDINDDFANTDLVVVIGANDVINPAANEAEGTPIYGMPILNVSEAKNILILNYDTKPGYAGVDNPLYDNHPKVNLLLGDASESLKDLISKI